MFKAAPHLHLMKCSALVMVLSAFVTVSYGQTASGKPAGRKIAPPKLTNVEIRTEDRVYKATPQGELKLHFYYPSDWKSSDRRPAILFFFGGGWKNGSY